MSKEIWTFKYEPKNLKEMIVSEDVKKILESIIKDVPNILIYGKPGTGKGTFTNILLKETGYDYIKINASDENSIDDVRTKIKSFATSLGITDKKIVYLNECLDENEEIIIGTIENTSIAKMKDLPREGEFDIPSVDINTGEFINDKGFVNADRECDIYELELEDGRTIKCSENHPFFVYNFDTEEIEEKQLKDIRENDKILSFL